MKSAEHSAHLESSHGRRVLDVGSRPKPDTLVAQEAEPATKLKGDLQAVQTLQSAEHEAQLPSEHGAK